LEALEDRQLLSTFAVVNTNDGGMGSLRQALLDANAHANSLNPGNVADDIDFNISGNSVHTIQPTSALPAITDPVIINGYSQPLNDGSGKNASPNTNAFGLADNAVLRIQLNGAGVLDPDASANGLLIKTNGCTVQGLVVNGFFNSGVELDPGAHDNTIRGNFIGTNATGNAAAGDFNGVFMLGTWNNTLGGVDDASRNLISGNNLYGVIIEGDNTFGNLVAGNYIGTDFSGTSPVANKYGGLSISADNNTVGAPGGPNVISGNGGAGIELVYASSNVVHGNRIGLNAAGSAPLGNVIGVRLITTFLPIATANNTIGGIVTSGSSYSYFGNYISGNTSDGVLLSGSGVSSNLIQDNWIGLDTTGTKAIPNGDAGVRVEMQAKGTMIGGTITFVALTIPAGNIISGNAGNGITLTDAGTTGNIVQGNYIGTNPGGSAALPNGKNGIEIRSGASSNIIGGSSSVDPTTGKLSGAGNVISGNSNAGIAMEQTTGNFVQGNFVGTDVTGKNAIGNDPTGFYDGIDLYEGSSGNTIGSTSSVDAGGNLSGYGNLVSGNFGTNGSAFSAGVVITDSTPNGTVGSPSSNNQVRGNFIGTDVTGTISLGNANRGVYLLATGTNQTLANNTIGGADTNAPGSALAGSGNLISGNNLGGILIYGAGAANNQVNGNYVGTDVTGTVPLANINRDALQVRAGAHDNQVVKNLISGNALAGVHIFDAGTNGNMVQSNFIGTDATGAAGIPNGQEGVLIDNGAQSNIIGGTNLGNVISANASYGIRLAGTNTSLNQVLGNNIGKTYHQDATLPNLVGVWIENGASNNYVGGTGSRNTIWGNNEYGVMITGSSTHDDVVLGNFIGGSGDSGVVIRDHAYSNTIGGFDANGSYLRNHIQFNGNHGVVIQDGAHDNQVATNFIGVGTDGTSAAANKGVGVLISGDSADNNTIGGFIGTKPAGNVISGNGGAGVEITGASGNVVAGNKIGTNAAGTAAIANQNTGILVENGANLNTIGGLLPGAGNIVSGNAYAGIAFYQSATGNVAVGNWVGLNAAGNRAIPNQLSGVAFVDSAFNNTVGGTAAAARNVISGNNLAGVAFGVFDTMNPAFNNILQGNYIGTDPTGTMAIANLGPGVLLTQGTFGNLVGGTASGAGNLISGNAFVAGVDLTDSAPLGSAPASPGPAFSNTIQGNTIGLNSAGAPLPNAGDGVTIDNGANRNLIGGTVAGAGNVIANNRGRGVVVRGSATVGNPILGNSIYANGPQQLPSADGAGIALVGGNHSQDAPITTSAVGRADGTVLITGLLHSTANTLYRVELFASPIADVSDIGQGQTFLDAVNVITDSSGNGSFTDTVGFLPNGAFVSATATDLSTNVNDTSGFSNDVSVINQFPVLASLSPATVSEGPFTLTVNGNNFAKDAVVLLDGKPLATTFVSASRLTAAVPAAFADENTANVSVANPGPQGGTSGALSLTITDAPLTLLQNDLVSGHWAGASFTAPVAQFLDAGGLEALDHYRASIHWGDGSESDGTVKFINGTAALVFGTHTYLAEGHYTVDVFVRDDGGAQAEITESVTIADAAFVSPVSKSLAYTTGLSANRVVASFQDADPQGAAGDYTATIDWGDGTPAFPDTSAGTITANGAAFDVSGLHSYATAGDYNVTVTITDKGGVSTSVPSATTIVTSKGTVSNDALIIASGSPISVSKVAQTPLTEVVANFIDTAVGEDPATYTALIDWADGIKTPGQVVLNASTLQVLGTHTYAREGTYAIATTLTDNGGSSATANGTITVADAPLTGVSKSLAFVEGLAASRVVASFHDADPAGSVGDYTTTINWGDGSTSPGAVSADGDGFDVAGNHAYARAGSYPVTVSITDAGGASLSVNSSASVSLQQLSAQGVSFAVTGKKNFTGVVATFTDPDPRIDPTFYSATISWGDGSAVTTGVIGGKSSPFTVSGSHTYGSFTSTDVLTITISDKLGRTVVVNSRVVDPPAAEVNQTWISQVFQDLLGRPAEPAATDFWSSLLDHGVDRSQIVQAIEQSPEFRVLEIEQVYTQFLQRAADSAGLSYFTSELLSGVTLEQVQAQIAGSAEFFQRAGGTTSGFLDALYQHGLGRAVDSGGQGAWSASLANGVTREQVAAAIFGSDEYRQAVVQAAYQHYLHRAADEAGLGFFSAALQKGTPNDAMIASLAGCDEFWNSLNFATGV
jgi:hypothetical protein